ncbi:BMC domain-containing protein [Rhodobacter capsulatus]|uniref:BMC domain-containing protein n=1 Tax=Rhodobacter capsulatus TaxID=1061 RepID=UPI0003D37260|nr:BMC domain-containing protein [Rhodobacter capsulatus]ETD89112.1 carboxysome shell protein [Rhodobacter capsulatus YW2]
MSEQSLGLIETLGLAAAVTAADAAVKSANVTLVGYEFAKGDGMTVVKLRGDVGAVKAAVAAAEVAAGRVGRVVATRVIARPAAGLIRLIDSVETVGCGRHGAQGPVPVPPQEEAPAEPVPTPPDASPSEASGAEPAPEATPEPVPEPAPEPAPAAEIAPEPEPDPTPEPPPVPYRLTRPKGPKGR